LDLYLRLRRLQSGADEEAYGRGSRSVSRGRRVFVGAQSRTTSPRKIGNLAVLVIAR
jgi:hypothetical protein